MPQVSSSTVITLSDLLATPRRARMTRPAKVCCHCGASYVPASGAMPERNWCTRWTCEEAHSRQLRARRAAAG